MTKKKKKITITAYIILAAVVVLIGITAISLLNLKKQKLVNKEAVTLFLPDGITYEAVVDSLNAHGCIGNQKAFNRLAKIRKYKNNVKGGCYKLTPGMDVWSALTKLYYGNQDPVRITINKHRTKETLCELMAKKLDFKSSELLALLNDSNVCAKYGHTTQTIIGMFPQNTYDIYWNTTPEKLLDRMKKESGQFWNKERTDKCKVLNLSKDEVITLASIVEEESNKNDEKPTIASVYLNRIRKGMMLQADPTLKYAIGDFSLQRVLDKHKEVNSPYNTYKHTGLPPGPICIPSTASIDAVLQNKQTDYIYFCAKSDFSGYHAFATNLSQHNANAKAFHDELNRRKIYK